MPWGPEHTMTLLVVFGAGVSFAITPPEDNNTAHDAVNAAACLPTELLHLHGGCVRGLSVVDRRCQSGIRCSVVPSRHLSTNWTTIPLFAHFRIANFTTEDLHNMESTLKSVTMQGTLYGGLSGEQQAQYMRNALTIPVLIYRNLYYAEPWDASSQLVRENVAWQLRGADGKPLNPESKFVYNMTMPVVQQFYTSVIANLSKMNWIDGAFADSGCGVKPAWLPPNEQAKFAAGQLNAASASQIALSIQDGLFIQNCPYLPREPNGGKGDPWSPGVRGIMYESWCSDFLTGTGGPGTASFCRYEILYVISGPASWNNGSVIQARYYLSPHNHNDPRFGAIAFLVCGYHGAFFGASTGWWWKGDWETQSLSDWAHQSLGEPGPAQMLDKAGCGWTRKFASGAHVFVNLCFAKDHPMEAHAVWADNTTWPKELGAERAHQRVKRHQQRSWTGLEKLPSPFYVRPVERDSKEPCPQPSGGGTIVLDTDGVSVCLFRVQPEHVDS